jgi:hypothetical protein
VLKTADRIHETRTTLRLALERYERKKNIAMAVQVRERLTAITGANSGAQLPEPNGNRRTCRHFALPAFGFLNRVRKFDLAGGTDSSLAHIPWDHERQIGDANDLRSVYRRGPVAVPHRLDSLVRADAAQIHLRRRDARVPERVADDVERCTRPDEVHREGVT